MTSSEVARSNEATSMEQDSMQNDNPQSRASETPRWKRWFGRNASTDEEQSREDDDPYRPKSTLGILSDKATDEVPGKLHR